MLETIKTYRTESGIMIDASTLNEYEKKNLRLSYATAWNRLTCGASLVLCNNLPEVDESVLYNEVVGSLYDEETEEYKEVYQWYITDLSEWSLDWLKKYGSDEFIISYSDMLDVYVLCVTHFGTSWDYVDTDIKIEAC